VNGAGQTVTSGILQDVRNGRLPASPDWRINVSPRYDEVIGALGLRTFAQADLSFQSDQLFSIDQDPLLRQEAIATVDLSIGIGDPDRRYTLTAFVKNVTNTSYFTTLQHSTLLGAAATPNDIFGFAPKAARRYIGATLAGRF
jgi:iron complex outermembrane receptor protein